jgi:hypothetical protein
MIKFIGEFKDTIYIGFGISKKNVELLVDGSPIAINLRELLEKEKFNSNKPVKILIFYGKTEQDMCEDLKHIISKNTKVFVDGKR